jgi:RNA polymerase sigma-70 factor (ECF subfamily)
MEPYNQDQFLRRYLEHEEALSAFARTLVPSREDDREVMQQAAVVLWRKFDQLEALPDFRRWAFVVVRFEALGFLRDRKRDRLVFDEDMVSLLAEEVSGEAELYESERNALENCLSKPQPSHRQLLDAAYASGARNASLAEQTGRSEMAIYKALHRLRLNLMECTQRVLARKELA